MFDVRFHIKQNRKIYFMLFLCLIVGVVFGIAVAASSDEFLNLITSKNKTLYSYINGSADYFKIFWKRFLIFLAPVLLIVALGTFAYVSLFAGLFLSYQTALFVLSCTALIKIYGLTGFLSVLFFVLPVNLIYLAVLVFASCFCITRSFVALKNKKFWMGFDEWFFMKLFSVILVLFVLSLVSCVVVALFLKNANFLLY